MSVRTVREKERLGENRAGRSRWRRWGPYVSERAWGTVREDYSQSGDAWSFLTHDMARSKAYRWGEDGLAGLCDRDQTLCLALALWNGKDPYLKERAFGLTGPEGAHGEDVKECYWYLDATPTSSYLRYLYKYPQRPFPYQKLVDESARRRHQPGEYELFDAGAFDDNRYWDVFVEYAKATADDIHCKITVHNRGPEAAALHVLPHLWFRKTWGWGPSSPKHQPDIRVSDGRLVAVHPTLGTWNLYHGAGAEPLFTHNETNAKRLYNVNNTQPYVKDAFHERVVNGRLDAVNPEKHGTKAALWYQVQVEAGASTSIFLRLTNQQSTAAVHDTDAVVKERARDCKDFYDTLEGANVPEDARRIHRQACAGLLWTMQYYAYDVDKWIRGDSDDAPRERLNGRNKHWHHVDVADVISMPDKWEYPWFAAWDLAFHCVALAHVDVELAKAQLKLMVKEWYQHPNGQIPAYEWNFSDLNPPVHAWATFQIYKHEARTTGKRDRVFLERIFHKLLMNFAWWVNRKDSDGHNIFEGGFLGLDNISLFDRSEQLPDGARLQQADATAWMAMFCLDLMRIALELAYENSAYEDMASKFFEHFLYIAHAINNGTQEVPPLWDETDGWYHDLLFTPGRGWQPLHVASLVGLIPMFAVHVLEPEVFEKLPNFSRRFFWFLERRPDLAVNLIRSENGRTTLSLLNRHRLSRVLERLLDEDRMLSPYGPRSLSREHKKKPYTYGGMTVGYEPAEAVSRIKGGNSNWRGPVWFPTSYLIIRALQRLQRCFGDEFTAACPTNGGPQMTLAEISRDLTRRMVSIFERGADGKRPVNGKHALLQDDPHFRDHLWFYEYFHGDTGEGLGASHQSGWTALVSDMVLRVYAKDGKTTVD